MNQKALQAIKLQSANQRAFSLFYDTYAPQLWGCIVRANLPTPQAEVILTNTFLRAWKQLENPAFWQHTRLSHLLNLAYQEGLPKKSLRAILAEKLYSDRS